MILDSKVIEYKGMPLFQKARFKTPLDMQGSIQDFACFFYMVNGNMLSYDSRGVHKLSEKDEVKFVLTDRADYDWMVEVLDQHKLHERVNAVLVSAVNEVKPGLEIAGVPGLAVRDLAEWILADR